MSLENYGVLVGKAIEKKIGSGSKPHYQIHIIDNTTDYRISVNVKSQATPSELIYVIDENYQHHALEGLIELASGFHHINSVANGLAIDFIRGNFFQPDEMVALTHNIPGPNNDLNDKIDKHLQRAISEEDAIVFAFGERWGPENDKKDSYFGFLPGNGIHDIHMNQGNVGRWKDDDGVWQDGALLWY